MDAMSSAMTANFTAQTAMAAQNTSGGLQKKARTEAVRLVGSHSRPTLGRYFIPVLGDGTVPGNSLQIGDEQPHFLKNRNHRNHGLLFSNPQTYLEMRDFFGWDSQA